MGDRGKKSGRSTSPSPLKDHRIRPINPPTTASNRGRRRFLGRYRSTDRSGLQPIQESRRPAPRERRIVIELPEERRFRRARGRAPPPLGPQHGRNAEAPHEPSFEVAEGLLAAGKVARSIVPSEPLVVGALGLAGLRVASESGTSSSSEEEEEQPKRSFGALFKSFRQKFKRVEVPPPAAPAVSEEKAGSQPATDESLSTHPSLQSSSLVLVDRSEGSYSESEDLKKTGGTPSRGSSAESAIPEPDLFQFKGHEAISGEPLRKNHPVALRSASCQGKDETSGLEHPTPKERPSSEKSLTPEAPVDKPVPSVPKEEVVPEELIPEDTTNKQAGNGSKVNTSAELSAEMSDEVPTDLYRIKVGAPVNIAIAYEDSGYVTTCIHYDPDRYDFDDEDEEDEVSDEEEPRSDDEGSDS